MSSDVRKPKPVSEMIETMIPAQAQVAAMATTLRPPSVKASANRDDAGSAGRSARRAHSHSNDDTAQAAARPQNTAAEARSSMSKVTRATTAQMMAVGR